MLSLLNWPHISTGQITIEIVEYLFYNIAYDQQVQ